MGQCQGRTCRQLIAREIAQALGITVEQVELPQFRPPTRPIVLSTIVEGEGNE